jgi:hypothetical protein
MMTPYTSRLGAGQGIIEETRILLDLWQPGMDASALNQLALQSGRFQKLTARRLRNLIIEGFARRYLCQGDIPAKYLKNLMGHLSAREFTQLLYLYTCRVHPELYEYIQQVYWVAYSSGKDGLSNEDARKFMADANRSGLTMSPWSDDTIERVAGYVTGTLADFGLLEDGRRSSRKILPVQIESPVFAFLAYDLHFAGHGDNNVLSHPDWGLFGLERSDVLNEFKRQALKGWWILQSAGDATRIGWQHRNLDEVIHDLAQ